MQCRGADPLPSPSRSRCDAATGADCQNSSRHDAQMIEFRMPSLGADMEAATLIEWTRHPGERVARGDVIAVVETQKGAIEIESFHTGVIDRILVQPGERVPV